MSMLAVFIIGIGFGFLIGYGWSKYEEMLKIEERFKEVSYTPCIHGHEDWDDCPDCCH